MIGDEPCDRSGLRIGTQCLRPEISSDPTRSVAGSALAGWVQVYLADHRLIGRRAAIKVLLPALSSKPDIVTRFFNEARATAAIRHPGIVNILDCDVQPNGRAYIVMEYLEGESLGDSLSRVGSFENDMKMVAATLGQIADALEAAHAKGIIHRDLKPDNVFLASMPSSGTPICTKILDFGVAKLAAAANEATKTQTGSLLGTPLYMSPEQCRGAGRVDHRADIYSLGCIGFEMIGGRPPFIREGVGDLMVAHISDPVPDIRSVTPSVPPELAALVMGMLEKNPDSRPRSMLDIVRRIERLVGLSVSQFGTLISVPAGFPSSGEQEPAFVPPDPGTTQDPSLRSSRQSVPEIRPGGTRLLSEKPTTFSRTPSSKDCRRRCPPVEAGCAWRCRSSSWRGRSGSYFVFWPRQPPKADYASEPQVGPQRRHTDQSDPRQGNRDQCPSATLRGVGGGRFSSGWCGDLAPWRWNVSRSGRLARSRCREGSEE